MAVNPEKKLEELKSELQTTIENHNKATQVAENCKKRYHELTGAIAALEDLLKTETKQ